MWEVLLLFPFYNWWSWGGPEQLIAWGAVGLELNWGWLGARPHPEPQSPAPQNDYPVESAWPVGLPSFLSAVLHLPLHLQYLKKPKEVQWRTQDGTVRGSARHRSLDFWRLLWALSTRPHYLPGVAQASCRLWARHGGGGSQESKKKKWEWGERSHLEAWEPDQWRKVQLPPHWCYQIWNLWLFSSSSNKGLSEWPGLSRTLPAVLTAPVEGLCSRAADPACSLALSTAAGPLLRWALLPVVTAGRPGRKGRLQLSGLAQSPAALPGFLFHSLPSAPALRMQPDLLFDRCENEPSPLPPPEVSASGWHL